MRNFIIISIGLAIAILYGMEGVDYAADCEQTPISGVTICNNK